LREMLVYASCFVVVLQEQRSRSSTPSVHISFFIFPIHPSYHFTNIRFAGIIIAVTAAIATASHSVSIA